MSPKQESAGSSDTPALTPVGESIPPLQPDSASPDPSSGRWTRWRGAQLVRASGPALWDDAGHGSVPAVATPAEVQRNQSGGTPPGAAVPTSQTRRLVPAAVIGGAALLSIPFLVVATGSHKSTGHPRAAVDDTTLGRNVEQPLPSVSASGPPSSASPRASTSPSPSVSSSTSVAAAAHTLKQTHTTHRSGTQASSHIRSVPVAFNGVDQMLLKNVATGLCADLPNFDQGSVNGPVNQYYCRPGATDNQMWSLQVVDDLKGPGGEALFVIRNHKDNLCMDIPDYGPDPAGTKVSEFPCNLTTQDNQLWYLASGDQTHHHIRNYASGGLCLRVTGGSSAGHDTRLDIDVCDSADDDWDWTAG